MGEWRYSSTILDLGTSWRWVVSFTPWPLYSRLWWAPELVWTVWRREKILYCRDSKPGRPSHSSLLYRPSLTKQDMKFTYTVDSIHVGHKNCGSWTHNVPGPSGSIFNTLHIFLHADFAVQCIPTANSSVIGTPGLNRLRCHACSVH
jgi:hypothetical protein